MYVFVSIKRRDGNGYKSVVFCHYKLVPVKNNYTH
jgi:hypothetical protein